MRVGRITINPIDALLAILLPLTVIGLYTEFYHPLTPQDIIHAMANGEYDVVDRHLDDDFDFLAQDEQGRTILHAAAERRNAVWITQILYYGGDVAMGVFDNEGFTPVHRALGRRGTYRLQSIGVLRPFLHAGVDVNLKTAFGESLLESAIRCSDEKTVFELLDHGAKFDFGYIAGVPAATFVARRSFWHLADWMLNNGIATEIEAISMEPEHLPRAIAGQDPWAVEFLLNHGANPNAPLKLGWHIIPQAGPAGRAGDFRLRTYQTQHRYGGPLLVESRSRPRADIELEVLPLDLAFWSDIECAILLANHGAKAKLIPRVFTTFRCH